jgi:hypothetical protein
MLLALPAQSFSGPSPLVLATIFNVSDLRLPFSSPPTTRRVTVEEFDPAPTRVLKLLSLGVEPHLGLMIRYLLLFDSFLCGRREGYIRPVTNITISVRYPCGGGSIRPRLHAGTSLILLVKVKVTMRLTVSKLVSLGVEPPHIYLLLYDSYGLFCGAPSLTRGRM